MSTTVTMARTCICPGMSPNDAMTVLNGCPGELNPDMMFVTMFICVLNEKTGEAVACNAGYCLPVVIRRELFDGYIRDGAQQSMQKRIMCMSASSADAAQAGGISWQHQHSVSYQGHCPSWISERPSCALLCRCVSKFLILWPS